MLFGNSPYRPRIRIALAVAAIAFGIVGNARLVLLGGIVLLVWGAWGAVARRGMPRAASQAANRFGGRR